MSALLAAASAPSFAVVGLLFGGMCTIAFAAGVGVAVWYLGPDNARDISPKYALPTSTSTTVERPAEIFDLRPRLRAVQAERTPARAPSHVRLQRRPYDVESEPTRA